MFCSGFSIIWYMIEKPLQNIYVFSLKLNCCIFYSNIVSLKFKVAARITAVVMIVYMQPKHLKETFE